MDTAAVKRLLLDQCCRNCYYSGTGGSQRLNSPIWCSIKLDQHGHSTQTSSKNSCDNYKKETHVK
jgi:hypothetical protein